MIYEYNNFVDTLTAYYYYYYYYHYYYYYYCCCCCYCACFTAYMYVHDNAETLLIPVQDWSLIEVLPTLSQHFLLQTGS